MRRGFTLIEVLVAIVVLEFGLFALMAASAVAARDLGAANRRTRARWLATDRVEQIRSVACPAPRQGQERAPGGLTEFWRVDAAGRRRIVTDSVDVPLSKGRRTSVVVRAWVLCDS